MYLGIGIASGVALLTVSVNNFFHSLEGKSVSGEGMIALGSIMLGSAVSSVVFLSASSKNASKAKMLLRPHESVIESEGHELGLGMQYYKKAQQQKLTGRVLLGSGIAMIALAPRLNNKEKSDQSSSASSVVKMGGYAVAGIGGHFLISASKNKKRATILLKKESIPFSYLSKNWLAVCSTFNPFLKPVSFPVMKAF